MQGSSWERAQWQIFSGQEVTKTENDEMNSLDTHLVAEYLRTIAELIRASQLTGAKAAELIDAKADALDKSE